MTSSLAMVAWAWGGESAGYWLTLLADVSLKGLVILAFAGAVTLAMRRGVSASARHMVWLLAMGSLLALPVLSVALSGWAILPQWIDLEPKVAPAEANVAAAHVSYEKPAGDVITPQAAPAVAQEPLAIAPAAPSGEPSEEVSGEIASSAVAPAAAPTPAVLSAGETARADSQKGSSRDTTFTAASVLPWLLPVWVIGAAICLAPLLLGRLSLWRLSRTARPITEGPLAELLAEISEQTGIRRPVILLTSDRRPMPMIWGIFRSKLLLPAEAAEWSPQRQRVVLLHELAHAARWDCLAKLIAHIACAVYWFNPLLWVAFQRMQIEAEAACDDLVLGAGSKPAEYAEHLLEIASGLRSHLFAAHSSIALARKSKLEGRLLAILDGRRNRRRLTMVGAMLAVLLIAGLAVPISILQAKPKTAASERITTTNTKAADVELIATAVSQTQQAGPWVVTLPSGVTVELIGVSENPSGGKAWWRPNGSPLAKRPYYRTGARVSSPLEDRVSREVAVRLGNIPAQKFTIRWVFEPPGSYVGGRALDADGKAISSMRVVAVATDIQAGQDRTTVKFGVAIGPWRTTVTSGARGGGSVSSENVKALFSIAIENKGDVIVVVAHNVADRDYRVVAVNTAGKVIPGSIFSAGVDGDVRQTTARFIDTRLDQIKEFSLQVRPFEWAEFKNVSLQPGHKTKVELQGEQKKAIAPAAQLVKAFDPAVEKSLRFAPGDYRDSAIDFDAGRVISPGVDLNRERDRKGTDAWLIHTGGHVRISHVNVPIWQADGDVFDTMTVKQLRGLADTSKRMVAAFRPKAGATYAFLTTDYRLGLMQILRVTRPDGEDVVSLRYKLLKRGVGSEGLTASVRRIDTTKWRIQWDQPAGVLVGFIFDEGKGCQYGDDRGCSTGNMDVEVEVKQKDGKMTLTESVIQPAGSDNRVSSTPKLDLPDGAELVQTPLNKPAQLTRDNLLILWRGEIVKDGKIIKTLELAARMVTADDGNRGLFPRQFGQYKTSLQAPPPPPLQGATTPLHEAAANGHGQVAEMLISRGANPNARDDRGQSPLQRAAGNGHDDMVQLLLKHGADINARDAMGKTALHAAAAGGHPQLAQFLLDHGAESVSPTTQPAGPVVADIRLVSADERTDHYAWRVSRDMPARLIHGYYTLIDGEISEHVGGGSSKIAESGDLDLALVVSRKGTSLELEMTRTWPGRAKRASVRSTTSCPEGATLQSTHLRKSGDLNDGRYLALWRGDFILDGKVVKSVVYAARISTGEDHHSGFMGQADPVKKVELLPETQTHPAHINHRRRVAPAEAGWREPAREASYELLVMLNKKRMELRLDRARAQRQYELFKQVISANTARNYPEVSTALERDSELKTLKQSMASLQAQHRKTNRQFGSDHKKAKELQANIRDKHIAIAMRDFLIVQQATKMLGARYRQKVQLLDAEIIEVDKMIGEGDKKTRGAPPASQSRRRTPATQPRPQPARTGRTELNNGF